MQTRESIAVSTRVTETVQKGIDRVLQDSSHLNTSDYVRDLIRKDLENRGFLERAAADSKR